MGATESKLKEEFLWSIAANKEGRVNAFLVVRNNIIKRFIEISCLRKYDPGP